MKFLTIIFIILFHTLTYAVPAFPMPVTEAQPDGTEFALYMRGDEFLSWHEDFNGYTILKNSGGYWVYALKDSSGQLYPSEHIVGKVNPASLNIEKSLKSESLQTRASVLRQQSAAPTRSTPLAGTLKNLVILVDFQDKVHHSTRSTKAEFERLFNEKGYSSWNASGSVKDYFYEVSYQNLTVESVVVDWVKVSQGYAYYGANNSAGHDIRPREMVIEALQLVEDRGFDFSTVDNDGDGYIDGLTVIHAGGGEEYSGNDTNYLHSHQWGFSTPIEYDGIKIHRYHTEPERMGFDHIDASKSLTRIGIVCHEMSHFFGLPDLYDRDYSSKGIGGFCVMASGSWNPSSSTLLQSDYATKPAHMSAWCKAQLGWMNPEVISTDGVYSLPEAAKNSKVYKMEIPNKLKEYFLIENRQPEGFDEGLPGTKQGMLIWHIDEDKSGYQEWNNDESHPLVDLEEASGVQHLTANTNDGDDGDYFRSDNATQFSVSTTPSNKTYSNSFLTNKISEISDSKETMTFRLSNMQALVLQGDASINERSSKSYSCMGAYADSSTESLSESLQWSSDKAVATVSSSGLVTTGNVYSSESFKLKALFGPLTAERSITINDVDPGFTKIDQMLTNEDYVVEAFEEFISPKVDHFDPNSISLYQTEFGRNIDYVNEKSRWYQDIVDEVNAGNNVVINDVTNGWNLISTPFDSWSPDLIDNYVDRSVFSFNSSTGAYEEQTSGNSLSTGKGYWILYGQSGIPNDQPVEYLMAGRLSQLPVGSFALGWTLTGSKSDTETLTGSDQGYFWNDKTQRYEKISTGDRLKAGQGYWIFSKE